MSRQQSLVLDTNVWLDNYCGFRENSHTAPALSTYAVEHEISLLYPITSLKDVYYIAGNASIRLASREAGVLSDAAARPCTCSSLARR